MFTIIFISEELIFILKELTTIFFHLRGLVGDEDLYCVHEQHY
tara:strand:- start:1790 stop:1918 length:129 start_codon:yes stop_codon:yes gene_type:complete